MIYTWVSQLDINTLLLFLTAIATLSTAIISIATNRKVEVVHKATNSMKDELVALKGKEQRAVGKAEGIVQGRKEGKQTTNHEEV